MFTFCIKNVSFIKSITVYCWGEKKVTRTTLTQISFSNYLTLYFFSEAKKRIFHPKKLYLYISNVNAMFVLFCLKGFHKVTLLLNGLFNRLAYSSSPGEQRHRVWNGGLPEGRQSREKARYVL